MLIPSLWRLIIVIISLSIICLRLFANQVQLIVIGRQIELHRPFRCHGELDTTWTTWQQPRLPSHLLNASQNNPQLIAHICSEWILPPSTEPLQLMNPHLTHYSMTEQSKRVDNILHQKTGGFYIECGAGDGETISNSLFFEKSRNWSGILIEGYQPWFKSLLRRHRRAYSVGACLSGTQRPMRTRFMNIGYGGGVVDYMAKSHINRFADKLGGLEKLAEKTEQMQCLPLYSMLKAIGVTHVDYFSLDIEGAELEVIKTIPLDEITVDVFTIEYIVGRGGSRSENSKAKLRAIKDYLVGQHGYEVFHVSTSDDVFLKRTKHAPQRVLSKKLPTLRSSL